VAERQTGQFERSVRLPEYVEGDRIDARFVDGVLHLTVPKSPAAQPRRIQVVRDAGRAPQQSLDAAPAADEPARGLSRRAGPGAERRGPARPRAGGDARRPDPAARPRGRDRLPTTRTQPTILER
jgi:hypothetical protein